MNQHPKSNDTFNPLSEEDLLKWVKKLNSKYASTGQDITSYLEGLYHQDFLNYWDYIHLDTLLTLQQPRTTFPDEEIFIIYHQITELYFKLCLNEIKQIIGLGERIEAKEFIERLTRMNRYFGALTHSFSIMVDGMQPAQFLKFRMSLLPASGFQSVQYRLIELAATHLDNLLDKSLRDEPGQKSIEEKMERLYWKKGAIELATGEKTLTLKRFEEKYSETMLNWAKQRVHDNIAMLYPKVTGYNEYKNEIHAALRLFDQQVNVSWPLAHYKSAVRYLNRKPEDIAATGGTNWQQYLPPRFQKRIFYPELWSEQEREEWGKKWVEDTLSGK
jgi:tryptophan 2,3-dioxygenase